MKKLLRPIAIVLTFIYLILLPVNEVSASISTVSSTNNALLTKWKGLGLIDKSTAVSELYKPIEKIDFIRFINNILNITKQADINFSDVPENSWYGEEVAKAAAAGYIINKDNAKFQPFTDITRLDAAVMVAKVFGLELIDEKVISKITDAQKLDINQLKTFSAVIEKGYLSQVTKGKYAPLGVLKLIDAMKMLDKCRGVIITKEGTVSKAITGNLMVNVGSVALEDMSVKGDIIIGEGVNEAAVSLQGVYVEGNLVVRGGGANSIIIRDSKIEGNLIVDKYEGNVCIAAQGTTTIENTYLKSGARLLEALSTTGMGFVNVIAKEAAADNQVAYLEGDFSSVKLEGSNINVKLIGKAEKVNLLQESAASFMLVRGNVDKLSTEASDSIILLSGGNVNELFVENSARGNRIEINGNSSVTKMDINDSTAINIVNGVIISIAFNTDSVGSYLELQKGTYVRTFIANAAVKVAGSGTISNAYVYANGVNIDMQPSSYYVASGINASINSSAISYWYPKVSFTIANNSYSNKIILKIGSSESINIIGLSPSATALSYISSNNSVAAVSSTGVITGIGIGTTTIHVMGQYPNYDIAVKDIEVSVVNN